MEKRVERAISQTGWMKDDRSLSLTRQICVINVIIGLTLHNDVAVSTIPINSRAFQFFSLICTRLCIRFWKKVLQCFGVICNSENVTGISLNKSTYSFYKRNIHLMKHRHLGIEKNKSLLKELFPSIFFKYFVIYDFCVAHMYRRYRKK